MSKNMSKFKEGDEVVRISSSHLGMEVGDTAVITKQYNEVNSYCLDKYEGTHMGRNLQLVANTKFKVGDVIIHDDIHYRKRTVLKIDKDNYQLYSHNSDTDDLALAIEYIDRKYHLAGEPVTNKYPDDSQTNKEPESAMDTQVGGNHYKTMGLQPLEACYLRYGYSGFKAAIHMSVDKYFRTKSNEVEDLEKAKHCIEMLIEKAKLEATKK